MTEVWLTTRELAAELRVSVRTVQRLAPPGMLVGGQWRYHLSEVEKFLRSKGPVDKGQVVSLVERLPRSAA